MLLTKNEIKAVKKLVFKVVRKTMVIQKLPTDFQSRGVDLSSVLVWAIREQQLYSDRDSLEFNIKLDGRPLGGVLIEIRLIILLLLSNNIIGHACEYKFSFRLLF